MDNRPQIVIEISGPQQPILSGERVEATIKLTNQSHETIDASSGWYEGVDAGYEYYFTDLAGKQSPRRVHQNFIITSSAHTGTLAPSLSSREIVPLSEVYNMIAPGKYRVQVSRSVELNGKEVVVQSNIITITILPRP